MIKDGEVLDTTGGGFFIENCSNIEIKNMDFFRNKNKTMKGGALSFSKAVNNLKIKNSVFYDNFGGD